MVLDIDMDFENNRVKITEETTYGTIKKKTIDLEEFLKAYASYVKEKEDKYSSLYFPPGTVEYRKIVNSVMFFVETNPYKKFYEVDEKEDDYFIVAEFDLSGKFILSFEGYKTKGSFNKYFSSFSKVLSSKEIIEVFDENDGIKVCLNKVLNYEGSQSSVKLKYSELKIK